MNQSVWRVMRTWIRYLVYTWCVLIVLFPILICGEILFGFFSGPSEFTDLPGGSAKWHISHWPASVEPGEVRSVYYKSEASRDSYSSWYRIELPVSDAEKWIEEIHGRQEGRSRGFIGDQHEGLEGVRRTIAGPPPLHRQTGETPVWWKPPDREYRATEVMLWYKQYYSGVGRATYTAFDEQAGVLWIYDYACQHDVLWRHEEVPEGEFFTSTQQQVD